MAQTRSFPQLLLTSRISSLTQTQHNYKVECSYVNGFPFLAEGLDVCFPRSADANGHKYVNVDGKVNDFSWVAVWVLYRGSIGFTK